MRENEVHELSLGYALLMSHTMAGFDNGAERQSGVISEEGWP
jgi:hypothetical protein